METPRESTEQQGRNRSGQRTEAASAATEPQGGSQQNQRSEAGRGQRGMTQQGGRDLRGRQSRAVGRPQGGGGVLTLATPGLYPFSTMLQLSRELDQLVDTFFGRGSLASFGPRSGTLQQQESLTGDGGRQAGLWIPRVEVQQRGDAIVARVDLPGVDKEDVEVDVNDDGLVISGERREEREEGDENQGYRLCELSYGGFTRTIPLPEGAKPDQAKASMENGVLEIVVPLEKRAEQQRHIRIEDTRTRTGAQH